MRCPDCNGIGIHWNVPVASLAVVKLFPNLHGFKGRERDTTNLRCRPCKGTGRIDPKNLSPPKPPEQVNELPD